MVTNLDLAYDWRMEEAVQKGAERLDIASDTWAERVDPDVLFIDEVSKCLLTQVFGGYKEGLDYLGIDLGEEFGFDIPDDIYDIGMQFEAYEMLAQKWSVLIESRTQG